MFTSAIVEKYPFAFIRIGRDIFPMMLDLAPRLEGLIFAEYAQGIRFLRAFGFTFGETVEMGPGRAPFIKFSLER